MAGAPDIAALNARALAHHQAVLARIIIPPVGYHPARLTGEARGINYNAPLLPGLHVRLDGASGRWNAASDTGSVSGRGFVSLVATLADVSIDRAAAWLAHLPELAEATA